MKNLDLNNYGVQEMNAEEMNNVDGGLHPVIVGALISFFDNFDDFKAGFKFGLTFNN